MGISSMFNNMLILVVKNKYGCYVMENGFQEFT